MKPFRSLLADARRHRGLALIIVLSMLALATIVILAFLSIADTEHKATITYSSAQTSRRLADTAVNLVVAQIRAGSQRDNNTEPVIHATQPGAVRKYNAAGIFIGGYKLFSDKDMVFRAPVAGADNPNQYEEQFVSQSEPPNDWNTGNNIARYVDINEPVVKGVLDAAGNATTTQTYFPVIDPRAAQDIDPNAGDDVPVEGFSYAETTALNNNNIAQVSAVTPQQRPIVLPGTAGGDINDLRLAMPVQWLYILRDGAVGYMNDNLQFNVLDGSSGGLGGVSSTPQDVYGVPSETNPIVGRIAFWTDDESCKVNINTAAEPTYVAQPVYYHERDQSWADFPPARSEYQRFPGHPATVALSSVLFPNPLLTDERSLDTYGPRGRITGSALSRALAVKERLYDLIPRIHTGGSVAGTRAFAQDEFRTLSGDATNATAIAIEQAAGERLYASVDELLFSQTVSGRRRVLNDAVTNNVTLFNRDSLERASAFLTAHSRASEINMYGLPRITMWPIAESSDRRTGFDNLIEFCSRLGSPSNSYIFQRAHARTIPTASVSGASYDISISRNQRLMSMLDKLVSRPFPTATYISGGGAPGAARSYVQKYGQQNARQMLVQFFDYIRSTNLYDSFLVPTNRNSWPAARINWNDRNTGLYVVRDNERTNWKTYTDGVVRDSNGSNISKPWADKFLPGHGQVTPAEWTIGGTTYRGFGRFVSISEVGLQFICTADGQPDMYSWRIPLKNTAPGAGERDYLIPLEGEADENLVNYVDYYADSNNTPNVSGGRTALKLNEAAQNSFAIEHVQLNQIRLAGYQIGNLEAVHWADKNTAGIKERYYSNFPPITGALLNGGLYNTSADSSADDLRRPIRHPGYDPKNWNHTLSPNQPLGINEKRLQAMLHLEFFCPSVGYTELNPDMTIVISSNDVSSIEINGRALFSTTQDVVLRSEKPLYSIDSAPEVGGFASFRKFVLDRRVKAFESMPEDVGYDTSATSSVHSGLLNLDLVSSFFTVDRNQPLQFSSGTITVNIYDTHDWERASPVQTVRFRLESGQAPTPDLVTAGSYWVRYTRTDGSIFNIPPLQAPRWWGFHRDGVLGRNFYNTTDNPMPASIKGRFNTSYPTGVSNGTTAADSSGGASDPRYGGQGQRVPGAHALIYGKDPNNAIGVRLLDANRASQRMKYGPGHPDNDGLYVDDPENRSYFNKPWHFGSDTVRSLQPAHGDARMIAAKKLVEANEWTPHRLWNDPNEFIAHNFSSYNAGGEPGFDYGTSNTDPNINMNVRPLPPAVNMNRGTTYVGGYHPDAPHGRSSFSPNPKSAHELIQRYYDFDDSDPGGRIGPFINKVDEGNYSVGEYIRSGWSTAKVWRGTYYRSDSIEARFAAGQGSFFTPNRMVSSPVLFGSLPSRVWDNNGDGAWTNLLFRPHVVINNGVTQGTPTANVHPGEETPPDHYLLDLFWMPVVEPYAISESLSTAGKINMNYQMLPFTHIRRATAMHALMKGELFAALPNNDYVSSREVRNGWGVNGSTAPVMRNETNANAYWHRSIAIDRFKPLSGADNRWWEIAAGQRVQATLRQFEERFNFGRGPTASTTPPSMRSGLFRSASQICEIHLIPNPVPGGASANVSATDVATVGGRDDAMANFWAAHCATGDNTRERPYSNLYARLTTRSNTFRVHVRAQSIRKSLRSVEPDRFDPNRDLMTGEFRGSFLLERYIDQGDLQRAGAQVDFAAAADPFTLAPLENYYRFRILESKRFAP